MPDPTPLPAPEPTPPSSSTPPSSTPPSSTPPTSLAPDHHLEALATAAQALADDGASAGLGARVPTCPRWRVADLIAHQGMVHRWATATLRREEVRTPSKTEILRTVPRAGLLAWFTDGAAALLATFADTPPDADAMVFLNDAPAPRAFWARRQAHETTIHAVDALAARLGRPPEADEVAIPTDLALDGIDELLRGFFTRGRSRLATDRPFTIAVLPTTTPSAGSCTSARTASPPTASPPTTAPPPTAAPPNAPPTTSAATTPRSVQTSSSPALQRSSTWACGTGASRSARPAAPSCCAAGTRCSA